MNREMSNMIKNKIENPWEAICLQGFFKEKISVSFVLLNKSGF